MSTLLVDIPEWILWAIASFCFFSIILTVIEIKLTRRKLRLATHKHCGWCKSFNVTVVGMGYWRCNRCLKLNN